jgi:arylsulfatase A-like enzyme
MRAFFLLLSACFAAQLSAARPNILHIHADDHRADGLGALGAPGLLTPNLDTLVARGFTFTRAYTQGSMIGAVCTPSRTMMLTGRSWQRIPGAKDAHPDAKDPKTFLPSVLASAGYRTWHMGKGGNGFPAGLRTFQTSILDEAKGTDNPATDRAHASQRLADRTIAFLKEHAARQDGAPFYAYLAPPVPHDPRSAEPRFHAMYEASKIPLSPAFMPSHPWNNGEMTVRDERLAPWPRTPEDTRQQTADYYACVTGLDHHIGRIFAALKETGQWENTIIVFSGDNGLSLGEHGLFGKQNLYEYGGMHVPLVIAGPGIPQGRTAAFAYLMDLFPTFAKLAEAKLPPGVEGQDLLPVIRGEKPSVRTAAYLGYRDCMRSVSDGRWKLIRYPLVDRTQLFDLEKDPRELTNLAESPAHAETLRRLQARLGDEMKAYDDAFPLSVANPAPADWTPPSKAQFAAEDAKAKASRKKKAANPATK